MRVGISGKGGAGKTTISALLSRTLARSGHRVVAIDCDSDPNLAANSGVKEDRVAALRPLLDQSGDHPDAPDLKPVQLLAEYGLTGPDGVTFLLAARVEKAGGGWTGASHVTVRDGLRDFEAALPEVVIIADMEAGLEHLSWAGGTLRHADLLLVVAEPQVKSLLTASRTIALARQLGIPRVGLVGNRGREDDRQVFEAFARQHEVELLAVIPEDEAIIRADRVGECVLDSEPSAVAVRALESLTTVIAEASVPTEPPSAAD